MARTRTVVTGAHVVTMDPGLGTLTRGSVLIEDGLIVDVGLSVDHAGADVIDGGGGIVMPGLVDTHRHCWQGGFRGIAAGWSLSEYLERVFGIGGGFRPEDVYANNLLSTMEALESGVTTLLDWSHIMNSPEHADAAVEAHWDGGARTVFAMGSPNVPALDWYVNSDLCHPADIRRVRNDLLSSDDGRVTLAMAARGPEYTTLAVAADDIALGRDLGLLVSMHVGAGVAGRACRAVTCLADEGLLGPDLNFVHCNTSTDEELRQISSSGGSVSLCPRVEMQMGHGVPATGRCLDAGLLPSLSTDVVTGVNGSIFEEMRTALAVERMLCHSEAFGRGETLNELPLSCEELLRMATVGGAEAIGLGSRIGSLTPGRQADIVILNVDRANTSPVNDVMATVVAMADTGNVDTVIVGGEVVKRNGGPVVGLDRARALAEESRDYLLKTVDMPWAESRGTFA